jgi:GYF domain 2
MQTLWTVATRGGNREGLDTPALMALLRAGAIAPSSPVWRAGYSAWVPLQLVPELALAIARESSIAGGHDPAAMPPPPPGEPWFYNVAPDRALLLDVVSAGTYSLIWAYRHRRWLERRGGPITSPLWQFRWDKWLPVEVVSAADRVGVLHLVRLDLAPMNDVLLVLSSFCCCLVPVILVVGVVRLGQVQKAAEIVNQAVAPNAPRPPMDMGEWVSVLFGLAVWIGAPLMLALNFWLKTHG